MLNKFKQNPMSKGKNVHKDLKVAGINIAKNNSDDPNQSKWLYIMKNEFNDEKS